MLLQISVYDSDFFVWKVVRRIGLCIVVWSGFFVRIADLYGWRGCTDFLPCGGGNAWLGPGCRVFTTPTQTKTSFVCVYPSSTASAVAGQASKRGKHPGGEFSPDVVGWYLCCGYGRCHANICIRALQTHCPGILETFEDEWWSGQLQRYNDGESPQKKAGDSPKTEVVSEL